MIYHVAREEEWNNNMGSENYAPAAYAHEGFIHACLDVQLEGVLLRYFKGEKNLLVLHIEEAKLLHLVKYEPSTGSELFPHVYGAINKNAILKIERLEIVT
jgi:uncharacterized protein (DUF952 family)